MPESFNIPGFAPEDILDMARTAIRQVRENDSNTHIQLTGNACDATLSIDIHEHENNDALQLATGSKTSL